MIHLPSNVISSRDVGDLCWKLQKYLDRLREQQRHQKILNKKSDVELSDSALNELLTKNLVKVESVVAIDKIITELRTIERDYPEIHIIAPEYPSVAERMSILQWLRKEISEQLLCSFSVRTDMGGGFIVRTNKRQYDFSIKRRILNNKSHIRELYVHGK